MSGNISKTANQPKKPILLKHGLHAAFAFPLYAEGKLQAVLEFFSTTNQPPDKQLCYIVQSIGVQLGRVLERQRGEEQQRQAVAISDALDLKTIRSNALEATLNALTSGVYLTDRHGHIVYMNRAAKRQVGTSNAIRVANNHLSPIDHVARLALDTAIDEATADEADLRTSGLTIALPGKDNTGLIATVLPLARGEGKAAGPSREWWQSSCKTRSSCRLSQARRSPSSMVSRRASYVCSSPWCQGLASRKRLRCWGSARTRPRPTCNTFTPRPARRSRPSSCICS